MVLPSVATPDISGYLPAAIPEALSLVPAVQRGPDALSAGSGEEEDEEHLVLLGALAAVQSAGIWPKPKRRSARTLVDRVLARGERPAERVRQ